MTPVPEFDALTLDVGGVFVVHFDPRGLCRADDHPHIAALTDLVPG